MQSALLVFSFVLNLLAGVSQDGDITDNLGFYHSISRTDKLCIGANGPAPSIAGWIGLEGDTEANPKRSFFWYFHAEQDPDDAPIIMGGGPGSSGMMNTFLYEAPCLLGPNGTTTPNKNRWTEKFNLLALDHPIGVGYSYGARVNNSQDAALDVYDFLQKFFKLYPNLAKNQFVMADGSYGGVYLAHIASVIDHRNRELMEKEDNENVRIKLDSLVLHNPIFDVLSHFSWLLHYRCLLHQVHNVTTCHQVAGFLGPCIEAISLAFELPSVENSVVAQDICLGQLSAGDTHGILIEDIRKKCDSDDIFVCYPEYLWANDLFNGTEVKRALRVPNGVNFVGLGSPVSVEFYAAGDIVQPHHKLYGPLLNHGIRILFAIGEQDANCAWPGVLSSIKLLESRYQREFINAKGVPWPSRNITLRKVGSRGAGQLAYVLLQDAGHTVGQDQPTFMKEIVTKWITNVRFF